MLKDAQSLSQGEGFGRVDFRIGFTIGEGTLVVDDVQTRASGDHINKAKRLQDSASKGEFLTDSDTITQLNDQNILVLSKKQIVVKKNIIEAVKVGVKRAA
jgi:class 3 adenylate cyclase